MVTALVEARGLRRRRSAEFTLDISELVINQGEIISFLGPSGSGKSTLLHVLGLMESADGGELLFEGKRVGPRSRTERLQISTLLQSVPLFSGTVNRNVDYPLRIRRLSPSQRSARVREALELVGMQGSASRPATQLSGGEAQRIGLARALACKPKLLLLDEPLAHSDEPLRESLAIDLRRISQDWGFTMVWVTHDRSEALKIADRVGVVGEGRLLQIDSPLDLLARPHTPEVAAIVGTDNILPGKIDRSDGGLAEVDVSGETVQVESSLPVGADVFILLRPEDVTVTTTEPLGVAPRNRFPAVVSEAFHGVGTVKLGLQGRVPLVSLMTRRSYEELGLAIGKPVWCSFKATAPHVLRRA